MREIKFRAWDKLDNEWCAIDMAYSDATQGPISKPTVFNGRNQCVIMQYTGLKDRHGKDIFEGDIVKAKHPDDYENDRTEKAIVVFDAPSFYAKYIDDSLNKFVRGGSGFILKPQNEVIGNIYENPELLEEPTHE